MGTGFRKRTGNNKQVPYLSHEFIIQNHGDIATCVCMAFIVGLMFQTTTPLASAFVAPKHNVTELDQSPVLYTYGFKDVCLLFFYSIAAIIFHAIIQEYVLDKLMRKVKLSKTKASKFNESGQLLSFYILSAAWAISIFKDEGYLQSISFFWTGYPHVGLTFMTKFYFIIQMSYWIHVLPELYFQKVKREEMPPKITFALINFVISALIYLFNFSRIGITLLFIHHIVNIIFHFSRLMYFSGKNRIARYSFNIYNVLFVVANVSSIVLSTFVFWYGLRNTSIESINFEEKNFNTPLVRTGSLAGILLVQVWMLWNFIMFQCKKMRENTKSSSSKTTIRVQTKKGKAGKEAGSDTDGDRDLREESSDSEKVKTQ